MNPASTSLQHLNPSQHALQVVEQDLDTDFDLQRAAVFSVDTAIIFATMQIAIGHTMCQYRSCFYFRLACVADSTGRYNTLSE